MQEAGQDEEKRRKRWRRWGESRMRQRNRSRRRGGRERAGAE